jgi:hypothetical protein
MRRWRLDPERGLDPRITGAIAILASAIALCLLVAFCDH